MLVVVMKTSTKNIISEHLIDWVPAEISSKTGNMKVMLDNLKGSLDNLRSRLNTGKGRLVILKGRER